MRNKIKIGSLFAGIGGFELGIERAISNSETIWQVEKNTFCQSILLKHWPKAKIYNDVRNITINNVEPVDILIGGFPCQDLSTAGTQKGIYNGEKSSLWWEMHRIISEFHSIGKGPIVILENVANIIRLGGADVVASLAKIGYQCEWAIIKASDFGACHQRARWFCIAYPNSLHELRTKGRGLLEAGDNMQSHIRSEGCAVGGRDTGGGHWQEVSPPPAVCGVDDGISAGMDRAKHNKIRKERLKALGNAIVPQCSEWIGLQVLKSGLLDNLID